jgi:hypothetical protein
LKSSSDRPTAWITSSLVLSLVVVPSFWWRDHHADSDWVSTADVPVSPVIRGKGGPWQHEHYEALHCREGLWVLEHLSYARTTARDMFQNKRGDYLCCRAVQSLLDIKEVDSLLVYDAFHKFGRRWYMGGIILKKCVFTSVIK